MIWPYQITHSSVLVSTIQFLLKQAQYILQGYAVNNNRINQLGEVIQIMKRTENSLDSKYQGNRETSLPLFFYFHHKSYDSLLQNTINAPLFPQASDKHPVELY